MLRLLQYRAARILQADLDLENWQPHTPVTLSLGKEHRYTVTSWLGGPWKWSECFGEEKNLYFVYYILFLYIIVILLL
jgi:hypothetical protein